MTDLINFIPVRAETVYTIRGRMQADLNAGKAPSDPAYYDTEDGSITGDLLQTFALEFERLWDAAATDVVAAAFPSTAWGNYLDEHGNSIGVPRKNAVAATGKLTFTGTDGTIIPLGTEVSTETVEADDEPVVVRTVEAGTITGGTLTLNAVAAEAGSDGNILSGAATQLLTAIEAEIQPDVTNALAFTDGADVETDEAYSDRLLKEGSASVGGGSIADYERWALAWPGVGYVRVVPLWLGPGTVRVIVSDMDNNPTSAGLVEDLQAYLDPYIATGTMAGSDTLPGDGQITINESVAPFSETGRLRIGNNIITYTSKSGNTFYGCTGGSGSVSAGAAVIQSGYGMGEAPVGHMVTVDTPATLNVTVTANVETDDGYSLDGDAGTTDITAEVVQAIRDYVDQLPPGGDDPPGAEVPVGSGFVLLNRVRAAFFSVEGVWDVSSVQINGSAADLAVAPLQVPQITTVTLS